MNESTDDGDPNLFTSVGREQTQRSVRTVDGVKNSERTLFKKARSENDRECRVGTQRSALLPFFRIPPPNLACAF
jgi:hypothetical protein